MNFLNENFRMWLKTLLFLAVSICLFIGCETTRNEKEEDVVVIYRNRSFQCEAPESIKRNMLKFVNSARSVKHECGSKRYPAVNPVRWNSALAKAALGHSRDMAENDFASHTGSDGSDIGKRAAAAGYDWKAIGENISAGRETTEYIVSAWLNSPRHCRNMMSSNFTEIGAACFRNASSQYGTYWTLVLASPNE